MRCMRGLRREAMNDLEVELHASLDTADYQEMSIRGDRAGVEMRRIIARRAAEEAR
jgi:hypothetical protein